MQNYESLNKTSRKSRTMRKTFRFLNHFHKKHEFYNINSLHMRRFVKITRRMTHTLDLYTRNLDTALKEIVKRKKQANLQEYRASAFELIKAKKCKLMYTTKKTKNKKTKQRKTQRELEKKQKKQSEKQNDENNENFENVEIVVIEALNINLNNNDVKKMKYVNSYSFVLETFEAFVQNSNIDEKKFESEMKKFQLDENVRRFNALLATMSHDDF